MASRATFLVLFNLLFFTLVTSTSACPPSSPTQPSKTPAPVKHGHKHPKARKCPKDTLKLRVCSNLLNDLMHLIVGTTPKTPCCTLIAGLVDLEAAVCLCTAIKANVLGIKINVPVSFSLLWNFCGKKNPSSFQCA